MARIHEINENMNNFNSVVRSKVKSFDGKKVSLNPTLPKIDDSLPQSSLKISNTDEVWAKIEKTPTLRLRYIEDIMKESECPKNLFFESSCKMYEQEVNELQGLLEKHSIKSDPMSQDP